MSTPSQNQTNNNNSFTGNFSSINMYNANNSGSVQPDGVPINASGHGSTYLRWIGHSSITSNDHALPSAYMLEETAMSPGINFDSDEDLNINDPSDQHSSGSNYLGLVNNLTTPYVDEEGDVQPNVEEGSVENDPPHSQSCHCRRKRTNPDEASSSSHPPSRENEQVESCPCSRHILAQGNSSAGLNIFGPRIVNANTTNRLNQVNLGLTNGIIGGESSMPESSYVATHVESNSRNVRPRREENHFDLLSSSITTYVAAAAAANSGVPANQSQQIMFTPGSDWRSVDQNYTHSNLEEQYTSFEYIASSSTNIASASFQPSAPPAIPSEGNVENSIVASSAIAQPIPSFPGILPTNISDEHGENSSQQVNFGANVTLRALMASDLGDGRSFESFVREILRTIGQQHNELEAAFWRSRIIVAVHHAVQHIDESASGEGSSIADTLAYLMQNVGTDTTQNVGTDTTGVNEQMRPDIDNMTYEELLDLQESIGSLNTVLRQENILACMKRYEFRTKRVTSSDDIDRCCICLDEYIDGQEVGRLNCAHEFHSECIKEWLMQTNSCPFCKRKGFTS